MLFLGVAVFTPRVPKSSLSCLRKPHEFKTRNLSQFSGKIFNTNGV